MLQRHPRLQSPLRLISKSLALKKTSYPPYPWKDHWPQPVIGVDEVGRGCIAGEVYAAAVILNESYPDGLMDSKKLSEKKRENLSQSLHECAHVSIAFASLLEIEELNILGAALLAMKRAVEGLGIDAGIVLVDGNQKIPRLDKSFEQITLVKGDDRAEPVAAASIVAKVARDHQLCEMALQYPHYGFEKHKGYGTKAHREAIAKWGVSPIHRRTFAGVREHLPL